MPYLRLKRYERGLTATQVANSAGLHRSTVTNAEAGVRITPRTAKALANFYGVSVGDLLAAWEPRVRA